ncbi:MAG: cytochrome c biogenesis CcdA family protein [Balneolaceae bacterium]
MTLELASVPLAFIAGVVGVMSPCVWPLVPVVMSSASTSGRIGPLYLALGLSASFAVAGTFLTYLLINMGLNPDAYRYMAAALLILVAVILLWQKLGDRVSYWLSRLTGRFNRTETGAETAAGQFGVGALLGLVWLPCVGPTLGAAIALASLGEDMGMAFLIMLVFGIGTAAALLFAGYAAGYALKKWKPGIMQNAARGKLLLGILLLLLGIMVLTGFDKVLERMALDMLPQWIYTL